MIDSRFSWLSEEFLLNILEKTCQSENIKIESVNVENALSKGENFASNIKRIKIQYKLENDQTLKQISMIQKSCLDDPMPHGHEDAVSHDEFCKYVFGNEVETYSNVLPKINEKFAATCETGEYEAISPSCYAADEKDLQYIIFEDLSSAGYKNVKKTDRLDFAHMKIALKKLAKWHAGTAVLLCAQDFTRFRLSVVSFADAVMDSYMRNVLIGLVDGWTNSDLDPKIIDKMKNLSEKSGRQAIHEYITNVEDFNVIVHGDLWSNNILFQYHTDGKLKDAKIIDFAHCYIGSPGLDLAHLIFSSSNSSLKELEWDKLLQQYHEDLCFFLEKLNYPKALPTLRAIRNQFMNSGLYAAAVGIMQQSANTNILDPETFDGDFLPLFFSPSTSPKDCEDRAKIMSNPNAAPTIKYLLEYYDRKGFFN